MNDNKALPPLEQLKTTILKHSASIEAHMTTGLNVLLMHSGVSQQFAEVMTEFARPTIELVRAMEKEVLHYVQKEQIVDLLTASVVESQTSALEAWSDMFIQQATTPTMMRTAQGFKDFVDGMIRGKEQKGKEPKAKDLDMER